MTKLFTTSPFELKNIHAEVITAILQPWKNKVRVNLKKVKNIKLSQQGFITSSKLKINNISWNIFAEFLHKNLKFS